MEHKFFNINPQDTASNLPSQFWIAFWPKRFRSPPLEEKDERLSKMGGGGLNINGRARGKWFFDKKLHPWTFTYKEKFSVPSVDDNEDSCAWLSHELLECESAVDALKEILDHINHRYRAGLRQWDAFAACVYIKYVYIIEKDKFCLLWVKV